jgi:hypothetical protein
MANKRSQSQQLSDFAAGLVTDVSKLNFPPNALASVINFNLNRDGSLSRRLGMDFEDAFGVIPLGLTTINVPLTPVSVGTWESVAGDSLFDILVVQVGEKVYLLDKRVANPSGTVLDKITLPVEYGERAASFASIDGELVMACGGSAIVRIYKTDEGYEYKEETLYIRDLYGIDDGLQNGSSVQDRPSELTDAHLYNLRNQGWGVPKRAQKPEYPYDPIRNFNAWSFINNPDKALYPSNADNVETAMINDVNDFPPLKEFFPEALLDNPPYNTRTPKGHYIIDAFNRGNSRYEEILASKERYDELHYLPSGPFIADKTLSYPTAVESFAGRVFYAGIPPESSDNDDNSPDMSSSILFSQLVKSSKDIFKCYQDGDPTSEDSFDVLATDGGVITIIGANKILCMREVGTSLVVFAENGIWVIQGGSGYGFTADNYSVLKVSDKGLLTPTSVVTFGNAVAYWGDDAIYALSISPEGATSLESISKGRIQNLFENSVGKAGYTVSGIYDSYERKLRWIYTYRTPLRTRINTWGDFEIYELTFDIDLGAFMLNKIGTLDTYPPLLVAPFISKPFTTEALVEDIVDVGELVTDDGVVVTSEFAVYEDGVREVKYVTIFPSLNALFMTVSAYNNSQFKDWARSNTVGVDAFAEFQTGWIHGGDPSKRKQTPFLTTYLTKTETDLYVDDNGDWIANNPSSLVMQAQWDYSTNWKGGSWGKPFQCYRWNRHAFQDNLSEFDTGFGTVVTKNKVRGRGRSVSLYGHTEPEHDCRILGWTLDMNGNMIT